MACLREDAIFLINQADSQEGSFDYRSQCDEKTEGAASHSESFVNKTKL
jgi:hypothetical protein